MPPADSGPQDYDLRSDAAAAADEAADGYLAQLLAEHGAAGCERCLSTGVDPGDADRDCADCGGAGSIASLHSDQFREHAGIA